MGKYKSLVFLGMAVLSTGTIAATSTGVHHITSIHTDVNGRIEFTLDSDVQAGEVYCTKNNVAVLNSLPVTNMILSLGLTAMTIEDPVTVEVDGCTITSTGESALKLSGLTIEKADSASL